MLDSDRPKKPGDYNQERDFTGRRKGRSALFRPLRDGNETQIQGGVTPG